jgi:hypothetical protein
MSRAPQATRPAGSTVDGTDERELLGGHPSEEVPIGRGFVIAVSASF